VTSALQTAGLIFVIPLLSASLKLHDAFLLFLVTLLESAGSLLKPFAKTVWQFHLANALGTLAYSKYAVTRSLLSKCIAPEEVGRMFALVAVVATLASFAGNPLYRQLYNLTMADFPGAIFLLFGGLHFAAAIFSFVVFSKRQSLCSAEDNLCESTKL
jgi:MFS-type transporter involved in bile tolerance (Atg22 family)